MNGKNPHRRFNPLSGEWVLVSPGRTKRPWQGRVENPEQRSTLKYDPDCSLCPGNSRKSGVRNPDYKNTYVFDNDFPALFAGPVKDEVKDAPFWMQSWKENGICRVICYSPRHDLTLAELDSTAVRTVIDTWISQVAGLMKYADIGYVQVFENRGEIMGCSNHHPHGQIWATGSIPVIVDREDKKQASYKKDHDSCLLCDVLDYELDLNERVVLENDFWVVLVPFWAVWPFETLVLPRRHMACIRNLGESERDGLADILKELDKSYNQLFGVTMPFSSGWHIAPKKSADTTAWHMHMHFYPPLLRSATIRKYMVGYEMLAEPQRDFTPEEAAEFLKQRFQSTENDLCE